MGRPKEHDETTRRQLLDAAERLSATHGWEALTVRRIAEEAGTSTRAVYALFGETGVGVDEMPPVSTPVGRRIGFHMRTGSHGQNAYDWEQFVSFADRHFGAPKRPR